MSLDYELAGYEILYKNKSIYIIVDQISYNLSVIIYLINVDGYKIIVSFKLFDT